MEYLCKVQQNYPSEKKKNEVTDMKKNKGVH